MFQSFEVSQEVKNLTVPEDFLAHLEESIAPLGFSLKEPQKLAQAVLKLSDFFIRGVNPHSHDDYWKDPGHHAAYLAYFNVLNYVRSRSAMAEVRKTRFLLDARRVMDWGCGAGAASMALATECSAILPAIKITGTDRSSVAIREYAKWLKFMNVDVNTNLGDLKLSDALKAESQSSYTDTLIFSYVLNELDAHESHVGGMPRGQETGHAGQAYGYPKIPDHVQRLIIIEPSTNQAGRKLMLYRDKMIEQGWFAWAPCTHQEFCPLYNQSGKDWCHHRVHWTKPEWFQNLEQFLPMRNDTLTLSYLLLARQKPLTDLTGLSRVVGDAQAERGKTRQMICRGVNREFLSWLDRNRLKPGLKRGDIIRIRDGIVKPKEVRISFMTDLEWVDLEKP